MSLPAGNRECERVILQFYLVAKYSRIETEYELSNCCWLACPLVRTSRFNTVLVKYDRCIDPAIK